MAPCKSGLLPEGLLCINNNIDIEIEIKVTLRGGARGGLGGYSPLRSMLVLRPEVKSDFFGDFWHL